MRLRVRFSLVILSLILLSQVFFSAAYYYIERRSEMGLMYQQAMQSVQLATAECHEAMVTGDWGTAREYFVALGMLPAVRHADCMDAGGRILAHSDPTRIGERNLDAFGVAEGVWQVSRSVRLPGRGAGLARIGYDAAELDAQVRGRLARTMLVLSQVGVFSMVLGLLAAFLVARAQTRPIEELAAATAELSAGHLDFRLPEDARRDELGLLRLKFNEMAHRLGELDKMKRRLVESLTHDLKNPLAGIKASLQMMLDRNAGPLTAAQKKYMESSLESADRLWDTIDGILDAMRLQAGPFPIQLEDAEVEALVRPAAAGLEPKAERCGVKLKTSVPKGLPRVKADCELVQRVLGNLLANALKFTPSGGTVTLRAEKDGGTVRFEVRDTGAGIPAEELSRIFEPFYQVSETGSLAREHGSGLGLSICERIVREHGGRIWAESEFGKGSAFFFTLPAA
ncbi:MAG TPA: hypothetical protein DCM05_02295 [Elusimicrobia bacterium]|nr:hypothetical protein [Elusimicrobiota bacterium]